MCDDGRLNQAPAPGQGQYGVQAKSSISGEGDILRRLREKHTRLSRDLREIEAAINSIQNDETVAKVFHAIDLATR